MLCKIDARPSSEELGIYNQLHALLVQPNSNLLKILKEYKPASDEIRNAIATPNQENEDKAWNTILPTVDALREFYSYSSELGNVDEYFLILTFLLISCMNNTIM